MSLSDTNPQIDPAGNSTAQTSSGYTTEDAKKQAAGLAEAAKNSEVSRSTLILEIMY